MIDVSAPDDAVCNDCENFDPMEGVCMLDWTEQYPMTVACEQFVEVELRCNLKEFSDIWRARG